MTFPTPIPSFSLFYPNKACFPHSSLPRGSRNFPVKRCQPYTLQDNGGPVGTWNLLSSRTDLFPGSQEERGGWQSNAMGIRTPTWPEGPECLTSAASCLGGVWRGRDPVLSGSWTRRAQVGGSDHLGQESLVGGRAQNPGSALKPATQRWEGVGGGSPVCWKRTWPGPRQEVAVPFPETHGNWEQGRKVR